MRGAMETKMAASWEYDEYFSQTPTPSQQVSNRQVAAAVNLHARLSSAQYISTVASL
jgi:hypothetical protein